MRYINLAHVKAYVKSKGKRTAKDLPLALSIEVEKLIDKAVKAAGPAKTVTQMDLLVGMTGFGGGVRK